MVLLAAGAGCGLPSAVATRRQALLEHPLAGVGKVASHGQFALPFIHRAWRLAPCALIGVVADVAMGTTRSTGGFVRAVAGRSLERSQIARKAGLATMAARRRLGVAGVARHTRGVDNGLVVRGGLKARIAYAGSVG